MKRSFRFSWRHGLVIAILGAALFLTALLGALGKPDNKDTAAPASIEVTGILRLVGNEPFTSLLVNSADGTEWYIDDADGAKLNAASKPLLSEMVMVRGEPYTIELILANNQHIGTRKILRNISVFKLAKK